MKHIEVNGVQVPAIGFGTWQLKGDECAESVRKALKLGYRHIDTAQIYGNEEMVGRGIDESEVDRDEIFLTTKVWRDNLEASELKASVDESLEKLQTEYIDLLLIHWPFPELDLEDALKEMDELVEEGKVKNIGVSNFTSDQIEAAQELSNNHLMTDQIEYHPFLDQSAVLERCRENDMMLTAYSPLARGSVMGNEVLEDIGKKYGKSEAQITLRWLLQQEGVVAIPKASSFKHIKQNLEIFDFRLDEEDMERINKMRGDDRKVDPDFSPDWD